MTCQHSPDGQTLRLQAGAEEDDVIHLPSVLDRVTCERQEEEEEEEDYRFNRVQVARILQSSNEGQNYFS